MLCLYLPRYEKDFVDQKIWSVQGCGPLFPTFSLGWLENLSFFVQIICWAPWILHVQSTRLSSIFLRAELCRHWIERFKEVNLDTAGSNFPPHPVKVQILHPRELLWWSNARGLPFEGGGGEDVEVSNLHIIRLTLFYSTSERLNWIIKVIFLVFNIKKVALAWVLHPAEW